MRYNLEGLDCAHCAAKLESALRKQPGLEEATINFATQTLEAPADRQADILAVIAKTEPGVQLILLAGAAQQAVPQESHQRQLVTVVTSAVLLLLGLVFHQQLSSTPYSIGEYVVFLLSFLLVGWPILAKAFGNILRGQVFDENFLMSVASLGAVAIGELPEAAAVMVFYAIGEFLQELQVKRSRKSIAALLNIKPSFANLSTAHGLRQVSPDSVAVGQKIVVKPGERLPLDGEVLEGTSFIDTSALTGESVPRKVAVGHTVSAGTINLDGVLTVRVSKKYADSSVARILELVEKASERKAPAEKFITSFARIYTPIVVVAALLLAVLPPLLLPGELFSEWLYRSLVLLVISCPCALVVSVPLSYFGGIGAASRHGVLFKGGNYLDALAKAHTVVFDKTGTLTKGSFKVTQIVPKEGYTAESLLTLAASVEAQSNHPLAKSICAANHQPITFEVSQVREMAGKGISAVVADLPVLLGSSSLLVEQNVLADTVDALGSVVHIAVNGSYAGYIVVSDELREDAGTAIKRLKRLGVNKTIMLTGDHNDAAKRISEAVGLDSYVANLLPEQKVDEVERLKQGISGTLVFVGDGINDAPVIARADIGVAMGGLGSDAAIEAADVVIMQDSPGKLASAIEIARHTNRIVKQNVVLSLAVKASFMAFGVLGATSIWGAVFADVGVALLAVLNATRALRYTENH